MHPLLWHYLKVQFPIVGIWIAAHFPVSQCSAGSFPREAVNLSISFRQGSNRRSSASSIFGKNHSGNKNWLTLGLLINAVANSAARRGRDWRVPTGTCAWSELNLDPPEHRRPGRAKLLCAWKTDQQYWHRGKTVKWVSFTVFKKRSDHYFRHFEFECSQALWSHLFTMVAEAPMLFLGLILPTGPTLLASNYPRRTAHVILLDTTGDHHLHYALAEMKWPMGCSLYLMKGTEGCPSVGSPALSCFTLVGWVISGHSSACPLVTSDMCTCLPTSEEATLYGTGLVIINILS